ncbi:MAG: signal recognition particle-docking protein FtsY [Peptococcaceae bacterium]|nr:signal recognition particle-docking protein FtsY [Peptococcaceae bacterium]
MAGFFAQLKQGLSKTRHDFMDKVGRVLSGRKIDEDLYDDLEESLIRSDVGVQTALDLVTALREKVRLRRLTEAEELREVLRELIAAKLDENIVSEDSVAQGLRVILVVGVNGVGKTTTIGKLAHQYVRDGYKVLMAAGDTFRAAAIDQLEIWGRRSGVDVIKQSEGADSAAVVYDAMQAAKSRKMDLLLIDTAGRLHNKVNLMEELRKVKRVISREIQGAPHEVLLVLDATTGQNALQQAKLFQEVAGVTGIVLTKLDGTAKGGVVLGIQGETGIPVRWIGIGEGAEDLRPFHAGDFAAALFAADDQEEEGA